ncbi:hypothetical protein PVAND_009701 [Polypedilum vanderplanki]|uniref:Peptidase S1 domain-containing protein n=1 Tax=Polypedilum vanderplanki TaxID=319348 RepID=A0A9J6CEC7_POLVA|nr:hypothetical protein PVAND_009701 [Polypedilum vanderplanki]
MLTKFCILLFIIGTINGFKIRKANSGNNSLQRLPSRISNSTFSAFILNGRPADIENYPFKLAMYQFGEFFCGATVISQKWSLTAAHCLESHVSPEHITLTGGSSNRLIGGVTFIVEEYFLHPNYDPIILDYDAAVMRIKGSFNGNNIRPVVLANEGCETTSGLEVKLAGWGQNELEIFPEELYEIKQTIIDNKRCYEEWEGDITDRMMCADVVDKIDSCYGDSGGAVMKNGCLQVGIISFGSFNCGYPIPSVFTRIENREIRQFIRKHTGV